MNLKRHRALYIPATVIVVVVIVIKYFRSWSKNEKQRNSRKHSVFSRLNAPGVSLKFGSFFEAGV